jgi:hypothetical protein
MKATPFKIETVQGYLQQEDLYKVGHQAKRINVNGQRFYYYTTGEAPEIEVHGFYPSATTVINQVGTDNNGLLRWYAEKPNFSTAMQQLKESAHYGTFLHICCARLLEKIMIMGMPGIGLAAGDVHAALVRYGEALGYGPKFAMDHWHQLQQDIIGFSSFLIHFDARPIFVEKTIFGDGYAVTADAMLNVAVVDPEHLPESELKYRPHQQGRYKSGERTGQIKVDRKTKQQLPTVRKNILLEIKSSRQHKLLDKYVTQLHLAQLAWQKNYPKVPVDLTIMWQPSDWSSYPTYYLADATGHPERKNTQAILDVATNRLAGIESKPYKRELVGSLKLAKDVESAKFPELRTLSVMEAVQAYETGKADSLNVVRDIEKMAELEASMLLADAFVAKVS